MDADTLEIETSKYLSAAIEEWKKISFGSDNKGELKQVFLLLQAISTPRIKRSEVTVIPERLQNAGIEKKDIPVLVSLSQMLNDARPLVLLGEPGSGKSTLLQFFGLCFAHDEWANSLVAIKDDKKHIPIRIQLRDKALTRSEEIKDAAITEIEKKSGLFHAEASELFEAWIKDSGEKYQLVFIFDGLDEVIDSRGETINFLKVFARSVLKKIGARIIVSSRIAGYSGLGEDYQEFKIKPLQDSDEQIEFLAGWLSIKWQNKHVRKEAEDLFTRMKSQPALRHLLDNPLILRLSSSLKVL